MTSSDVGAGGLPARPLLPGFFQVIPMGPDRLQLRSSGRVVRLTGPGLGERGPAILAALDGQFGLAALAEKLGVELAVLERLVGRLAEQGVICDADGWGPGHGRADNRAAEQFWAESGAEPGPVLAALSCSSVALVGLGPVARLAAGHLGAAGVGHLTLAHDGEVTATDEAVVPSGSTQDGRARVEVAAEAVTAASGGRTAVHRAVTSEVLEGGYDLVLVEVDQVGDRASAANRALLASGTPFLPFAVTTLEAVVGPVVHPFRSACYECVVQRRAGHLRYYDDHVAYRQALREGRLAPQEAALVPGCAAMAAGLVSMEALRVLGGLAEPGGCRPALVADFRTLEVRAEDVIPIPGCPACGGREVEIDLRP